MPGTRYVSHPCHLFHLDEYLYHVDCPFDRRELHLVDAALFALFNV